MPRPLAPAQGSGGSRVMTVPLTPAAPLACARRPATSLSSVELRTSSRSQAAPRSRSYATRSSAARRASSASISRLASSAAGCRGAKGTTLSAWPDEWVPNSEICRGSALPAERPLRTVARASLAAEADCVGGGEQVPLDSHLVQGAGADDLAKAERRAVECLVAGTLRRPAQRRQLPVHGRLGIGVGSAPGRWRWCRVRSLPDQLEQPDRRLGELHIVRG